MSKRDNQNELFEATYVSTFMGGEFTLKEIKTVGDLRRGLRAWLAEVDGWGGDDLEIAECAIVPEKVTVTLKTGIVQ